jgi:hypothetical protein
MKLIFNDLSEMTIQCFEFEGEKLNIRTLETPETFKENFKDPLKTRKMTFVDDNESETVVEGYTALYSLEVYTGQIYGINMYKPAETPEEQTQAYADAITLAKIQAVTLDDETAVLVPNLFEMWIDSKHYEKDERVTYNGTLYKCLQAHDAQADWTPTDAPSLWAKVLPGQSGEIGEWEQPGSTNGYKTGDKVTHNGKTWESTANNNVWEPGAVGAPWKEVDA